MPVLAGHGAELRGDGLSGPANADPYARYRFVGNAFALVIVAAAAVEFIWNLRHPGARDFLSYWGAAQLALAGHPAAAYNNEALHAVQSIVATFAYGEMPFPYPPAYLLLVMPFGLLSLPAGMAAWTLSTLGFYLFAARRLIERSGWLPAAFPAVFANAAVGQNAFLTVGIFMTGLSLIGRFPFAAGLVLGSLIIKPQLALLLPVALVAAREWRTIAGGAVSSVGVLLFGAIFFGFAATEAWLHQLSLYATIAREGLVGWSKPASVYAAARQLGFDAGPAIAIHGGVALAAAAAVWRIWRSAADRACKVAILSAATALASPYLFFYDALVLVPAFFWLAREIRRPALPLALWCLPLLVIAQIAVFGEAVNLNPVAPIILCALIYCRWWAGTHPSEQRGCAGMARIEQPSPVTFS